MAGIITDPIDAVSEMAVPDIPENTIEAPILARESPPLIWPSIWLQNSMILSVIPELFIRFPARINPGMLRSTKTSIPEYNFKGMITNGIPSTMIYVSVEIPSAKAMGKRRKSSKKNSRNNSQIIIISDVYF
jgi:hypothetical protein